MDNVKNDFYYVKRLLRSIEITSRYLKDKSMDDLINDGFLCDAIENRFIKIAEDASNLSKDFKKNLSSIPWDGIASIRNRVCHDYDVVDFAILYKTIKVNFPSFKKDLLGAVTVHKMNLYPDAFELIESGNKKVEMMLNDEKRQKITIGDLIVFTNTETKEEIIVEVIDLKIFKSFSELYSSYEKTTIGYKKDEVANPNDMLNYYSQEQIDKYVTKGIERYYKESGDFEFPLVSNAVAHLAKIESKFYHEGDDFYFPIDIINYISSRYGADKLPLDILYDIYLEQYLVCIGKKSNVQPNN